MAPVAELNALMMYVCDPAEGVNLKPPLTQKRVLNVPSVSFPPTVARRAISVVDSKSMKETEFVLVDEGVPMTGAQKSTITGPPSKVWAPQVMIVVAEDSVVEVIVIVAVVIWS